MRTLCDLQARTCLCSTEMCTSAIKNMINILKMEFKVFMDMIF